MARAGAVVALVLSTVFFFESFAGAGNGTSTTRSSVTPLLLARALGTRTIYVVGSLKCAQTSCFRLYRTNVSASYFSRVATPPIARYSRSSTGTLDKLVFASPNDGYALVGVSFPMKLYATNNGARTWHRVQMALNQSILGLAVTTTSLYTVTAQCTTIDAQCHDYRLNRSALAATHWTSRSVPLSAHLGSALLAGFGFMDPTVGAYGTNVWISEIAPDRAPLFTSHNYGKTFTKSSSVHLTSVAGCAITAISISSLWAACPTGMQVSFAHSSDGGSKWTSISQHQYFGTAGGYFDPVSANVAYLDYGATAHNLYRLRNDGKTSTSVGELACDSVTIDFTSLTNGLALCFPNYNNSGLLERTTDGGARWSRVLIK
ncbi:MAG TPA: hypothetical protein VNF08_01595 [Acidimicrobiales bacterium]|nr:hypothetical protein [Acidimicrobiales bacterium]